MLQDAAKSMQPAKPSHSYRLSNHRNHSWVEIIWLFITKASDSLIIYWPTVIDGHFICIHSYSSNVCAPLNKDKPWIFVQYFIRRLFWVCHTYAHEFTVPFIINILSSVSFFKGLFICRSEFGESSFKHLNFTLLKVPCLRNIYWHQWRWLSYRGIIIPSV